MSISDVSICNSALLKLGADRINELTDDSKEAKLCNEQYSKIRDDLLREHPWNFAIMRVELALLVSTPEFGYSNEFQLPTDCMRVLKLHEDVEFKIEGRKLLTDNGTIKIKYIKSVTDPSQFDANFAEALSAKLAAELSYALVQSVSLTDRVIAQAAAIISKAKTMDAQEGSAEQFANDFYLNARF